MTKTNYPIVLASRSPRRQEFMRQLGLNFSIQSADIDESYRNDETPTDFVQRLSQEKAEAVAADHLDALIIAADTIVVLDNQILGKPENETHARKILESLRNKKHFVYSALAFFQPKTKQKFSSISSTSVTMRNYSDDEINAYIASGDPMDKAGAYAIQNREFAPTLCWDGCYANVMGFPLGDLEMGLAQFGIDVPNMAQKCSAITGMGCCLAW